MQPATFTVEEVATFKRQLEEGYDSPDPHYMQWLASVGTSCRPKPLNEKTQKEAVNSSCQDTKKKRIFEEKEEKRREHERKKKEKEITQVSKKKGKGICNF